MSAQPRFFAFHWPDHVIGKRESRRIRDAHNELYNSHAYLLEAVKLAVPCVKAAQAAAAVAGDKAAHDKAVFALQRMRTAIATAETRS